MKPSKEKYLETIKNWLIRNMKKEKLKSGVTEDYKNGQISKEVYEEAIKIIDDESTKFIDVKTNKENNKIEEEKMDLKKEAKDIFFKMQLKVDSIYKGNVGEMAPNREKIIKQLKEEDLRGDEK